MPNLTEAQTRGDTSPEWNVQGRDGLERTRKSDRSPASAPGESCELTDWRYQQAWGFSAFIDFWVGGAWVAFKKLLPVLVGRGTVWT